MPTVKSLGQHWLHDRTALAGIADAAKLTPGDTVLEIGPGLGTLTSEILRRAGSVIAVEFDSDLARKLPGQYPGKNLTVLTGDILSFDLSTLPSGYKVVANVPYYITSKIVKKLLGSDHKPSVAVLLVQKEVAVRLAALPGEMSILSISAQVYADVSLGVVVPSRLFTPPPKVDSQVVIFRILPTPRVPKNLEKQFFRIVKAGFSAKRKKLRSSLAGGLAVSKETAEQYLLQAGISPEVRAESLSIRDWVRLAELAT